jgi:hypothetical protein
MSDSNKKYAELYEKALENKLIEKGFGEKDSHDEEHVRKAVLKHFDAELTDNWSNDCEFYIYEESTSDGYSVWVATHDTNSISVNEHIHYYDSDLSDVLQDAIKDGGEIYVDDLFQDFIDDAMQELYLYLAERFHQEAIDELTEEGFETNNNNK